MLQAMFNGVSGVQAHKTALDIIGNNVANVNTIAFKANRIVFKDAISQTLRPATQPTQTGIGGTNPFQVGLGVSVGSADPDLRQGSMQPTNKSTDVAIEGNGFLITSDGSQKYYTRDGSFYIDSAGNLVSTGTGLYVLGWTADPQTGAIDTSRLIEPSSRIQIFIGQTALARATSLVEVGGNLNAESPPGTMQQMSVTVFDSQGVKHPLVISFVKTNQDSNWMWFADSPERAPATPATVVPGPTSAARVTGTQDISGGISLAGPSDLIFLDGNGNTIATATLTDGMTPSQVVAAIDTAFASVAAPLKVAASVNASGQLVLTNTTEGAESLIRISGSSSAAALSALGLSAGSTTGSGNFFRPPSSANTLTINGVTINIVPTDTAATVAQKINGAGAGVTATATNGKISLQSLVKGSGGNISLSTGLGYTLQDVFGVGYTTVDGTGVPMGSGTIGFDANGKPLTTDIGVSLTLAESHGAINPLVFRVNLANMSQLAGAPDVQALRQDGLALGTLESIAIGKDGVISGRFTNGITQSLAQLAMADFRNPAGLTRAGNNLWLESSNSGLAQVGIPSLGSRGRITAGFVELSNVDLPTEFTNMIVAQRGFQANARLITTSDEVLQELVQLKR
ncbi:MAG: flagellar hook-basal body complex protein [Armatimonadota bacterium]